MMETQSDSIDISSIKSAVLRAFEPPQVANFELDVSRNDRLKAIQHAFQRSVAAATTLPSQHSGYQAVDTGSQCARQATYPTTFSGLASTVPETQVLVDVSDPLPSDCHATSAKVDRLAKKMSTQESLPQDTQPVSQSIYESILSKVKSVRQPEQGIDSVDNADGVENEPESLQEGDEGHIDLLSGYKAQGDELGNGSDSEPVDFSPTQTQHHLSQFPESQRFKTPGTTSKKRNYNGETIEAPSLPRNPLARSGASTLGKTMDLSQAFAATQAVSSPLINRLPSDPESDRPSPNIELQTGPATAAFSSPLRQKSDLRRTATEPYSHYKSIKQSQAERDRLSLFGQQEVVALADTVSDDEFDDEPSLVERSRKLKEREEKVRQQLQAVSSPTRPRSGGTVGPLSTPSAKLQLSSPRTSLQSYDARSGHMKNNLLIHPVPEEPKSEVSDPAHESEEETEQEDEVEIARSSQNIVNHEEDKENSRFGGLEVPETVARGRSPPNGDYGLQSSPSVRQSTGFNQTRDERIQSSGGERFAVANSQPSQPGRKTAHLIRTPFTSSADGPSFVPQSQVLVNENQISSSPERSSLPRSATNVAIGEVIKESAERNLTIKRTSSGNEPLPFTAPGQPDLEPRPDTMVNGGPTATVHLQRQAFNEACIAETASRVIEARRFASQNALITETTIPETSSLGRRESEIASSAPRLDGSKAASSSSGQVPRSSAEFETARTHVSAGIEDMLPSLPQLPSFVKHSPSGRKRQRMIDITQGPSPRKSNNEIDMDMAMETVMDTEFQLDTSSPISPRRRIKRRRLLERRVDVVVEKAIPSFFNPPEHISLNLDKSHGTSLEVTSPPDPADLNSSDPLGGYPQVVRPMLFDMGVKHQLTAPSHKPILGKASARSLRVRDDLFEVQVSPEKSGTVNADRSATKHQGPPSTMPTRKARVLISATDVASVVQVDRRIGRRSRGSILTPNEDPGPVAIDVSKSNSLSSNIPLGDIIAPNQILACFNGKTRAYYPATCLGCSGSDPGRYRIQWEGFEADETDVRGVRKLDLRIGDSVKVNLDGFPRISHIVRGFKDRVLTSEKDGAMTDIRGYKILLVAPKQRKSLPAELSAETLKEVPISAIYLDSNMWNQMKGRDYEYVPQQPVSVLNFATPPERPSTPATPLSRSKRNLALSTSTAPAESGGIFAGMMFAISYDEARKSSLTHIVRTNGGIVLQGGFHELFANDSMMLKSSYENVGFTALLADRHSRKEKYMQALALNLPCLSGRWIESCVGKETIIDWRPYLLPAGESAVLDGATRSRILPAIAEPAVAKMIEITEMRPQLLKGSAVIFVTGRGKVEEKRKPFVFLTQAIGADRIEKVLDLKAAKTLLDADDSQSREYKWVFVDDGQVELAKTMLEGKQDNKGNRIRVVGNEFICQSLILGGLIED